MRENATNGFGAGFRARFGARLGAALVMGALAVASDVQPAAAQTDPAAARALFTEGRQLMGKQRYAEACPKFEESLRLDPGMGTQFNLAHCWEKIGRTASAWALFLDVAAAARAANQPQREAAAKERANALESKLTRLRIVVPDPAPEEKVFRDDAEIGSAAWGTPVPIDPGDHVIRVTAKGKKDWSQDVKVPETASTLSVTVPPLEDLPPPPEPVVASPAMPAAADEVPPPDRASSGPNVPAIVLGGVGLAGLATGTVFAIKSRSDNSEALKLCHTKLPGDAQESCANDAERDRHSSLVSDAKREQTIAFIGFGVGGAAAITAAILYFTGGSGAKDSAELHSEGLHAAGLRLDPMFGLGEMAAGNWGATLSGRF